MEKTLGPQRESCAGNEADSAKSMSKDLPETVKKSPRENKQASARQERVLNLADCSVLVNLKKPIRRNKGLDAP